MENRNSADYIDMGGIVKARRRQTSIQISFHDVKTRPYSLRAKLLGIGFSYAEIENGGENHFPVKGTGDTGYLIAVRKEFPAVSIQRSPRPTTL